MRSEVEQIKDKIGIVEVVQNYVKLERAGANLKGKCPFHNEKTPSFFVSPERGTYFCFGCNAKGDVFTFIEEFEKVDFLGALKILAERAGVELNNSQTRSSEENSKLFKILEASTEFFENNLEKREEVKRYLLDRGLLKETIKKWRIGFAPNEWHKLHTELKERSFVDDEIRKAGMIKKGEKGYYDYFRGRIIFPIFDPSERIIGFTGRIWQEGEPKYLNSPDTELFNKSEILYGYHRAKNVIRQKRFSLLVEGQMDLLMCQQSGLGQSVATSGTALTEQQLMKLKRFSSNIMIAYDGDKAGFNASKRAFALALSLGFDVKVAPLPKNTDPADMIKKDPEEFKDLLRHSLHIVEYTLQRTLEKDLKERALLKEIREEVLPYVGATVSPVERAYFISLISEKVKIPEEALYHELAMNEQSSSIKNKVFDRISESTGSQVSKQEKIERKLAGIYFSSKPEDRIVIETEYGRLFSDTTYLTLPQLIEEKSDQEDALMFEIERESDMERFKPVELFKEIAGSLKKEILKKELAIAYSDLKNAEKQNDLQRAEELLKVCNDLTKRLSYLKM